MRKHTPLVIGNWKMNPVSLQKAESLYKDVTKNISKKITNVQVGVCPPSLYTLAIAKQAKKSKVFLGAQDVSFEKEGPHTGEISTAMLKLAGVTHVIVGHSEKRAHGETDGDVAKKAVASLASGLTTIVCIGEKERDAHGHYFGEVESALRSVLVATDKKYLSRLVVAYEPVWAIGTGKNATAEDVQEMKLFIQKIISEVYDRSAVEKVRIIYGGSVSEVNVQDLCEHGAMHGFLVGGASLKPAAFGAIVRITGSYGK